VFHTHIHSCHFTNINTTDDDVENMRHAGNIAGIWITLVLFFVVSAEWMIFEVYRNVKEIIQWEREWAHVKEPLLKE
jgi:hypothetical protein